MDVEFVDKDLDRLETDIEFMAGYSAQIVRAFRKLMQTIRAAKDERDLYSLKSLHFEKLGGKLRHQRSMRLNDQYRLIVELVPGSATNMVRVVKIDDYH